MLWSLGIKKAACMYFLQLGWNVVGQKRLFSNPHSLACIWLHCAAKETGVSHWLTLAVPENLSQSKLPTSAPPPPQVVTAACVCAGEGAGAFLWMEMRRRIPECDGNRHVISLSFCLHPLLRPSVPPPSHCHFSLPSFHLSAMADTNPHCCPCDTRDVLESRCS